MWGKLIWKCHVMDVVAVSDMSTVESMRAFQNRPDCLLEAHEIDLRAGGPGHVTPPSCSLKCIIRQIRRLSVSCDKIH